MGRLENAPGLNHFLAISKWCFNYTGVSEYFRCTSSDPNNVLEINRFHSSVYSVRGSSKNFPRATLLVFQPQFYVIRIAVPISPVTLGPLQYVEDGPMVHKKRPL